MTREERDEYANWLSTWYRGCCHSSPREQDRRCIKRGTDECTETYEKMLDLLNDQVEES